MQNLGEVQLLSLLDPSGLFAFAVQIFANPWIALAMLLLLLYTLLYLSSLSWLDLSYLLPMTTLSYVLNALLAWLLLGEEIAETRWMGTLIIMIGVLVVGIGGNRSSRRKQIDSRKMQ